MSEEQAKDALKMLLERFQQRDDIFFALSGDGSEAKTADVAGRPGWAWVRYMHEPSRVSQVWNRAFPGIAQDVPVIIGRQYSDAEFEIIGIHFSYYKQYLSEDDLQNYIVPKHAATHYADGYDPVWIYRRAIVMLRARPVTNELKIYIEKGDLPYHDMPYWAGGESDDLTTELPPLGHQKYLTFYIARPDGMSYISGYAHLPTESVAPPDPPIDSVPICYVLLKSDSTKITEDMIYDARRIVGLIASDSITAHNDLDGREQNDAHPASAISVAAAGFSGNLSYTDTDVQRALATIDAMQTGSIDGNGTAGRIAQWLDGDTITDSTLAKTGTGIVTIDSAHSVTITNPHHQDFDLIAGGGTVGQLAMWSGPRFIEDSLVVKVGAGIITFSTNENCTITFARSGTIPVGTGTAGRIAEWVTNVNTLRASTLAKTGAGVLTLSAAANYTLTIPNSGTVILGTGMAGRVPFFLDANTLTTSSHFSFAFDSSSSYLSLFRDSLRISDLYTSSNALEVRYLLPGSTETKIRLENNAISFYVGSGSLNISSFPDGTAGFGHLRYSGDLIARRDNTFHTGYVYVPLAVPVTHPSWDGDAKAIGTYLLRASDFGITNTAKALKLWIVGRWSVAGNHTFFAVRRIGSNVYCGLARSCVANVYSDQYLDCTLSASGEFDAIVVGANALEVFIYVIGYYV